MLLQRFLRQLRQMPFLKRAGSVHWKAKLMWSLFIKESTNKCTARSCSHFITSMKSGGKKEGRGKQVESTVREDNLRYNRRQLIVWRTDPKLKEI